MFPVCNAWNWLTWGATALALILSFRGQVQHCWSVLIVLGAWLLRWSCSAAFRVQWTALRDRLWRTCEDYPRKQSAVPWMAALLLVVIPAGMFFLANTCVDDGDNTPVMLAACSLAAEGDWELSEFLNRPAEYPYVGAVQNTGRGTYSSYPAGPVQFALPVAMISKLAGANYQRFVVQRRLHKWTAAWLSATSLGLFFLTCLHLVEARPAWVMSLLLATGSAMYSTIAQGLWQHGGVIFWSQLIVLLEFHRCVRPARSAICLQGLGIGFMLACRLSAALVIVPLGLWVFVRDWRRGVALAVLGTLFYLPWAWFYWSAYGRLFGPSTGQLGSFISEWDRLLLNLAGALFSPGRGFFVYQAWGLLALGSLAVVSRRTGAEPEAVPAPAGWQWACASCFTLNLAMVSAWTMWWGGWCWGSRLMSDSLLLFALLCVRPVARLLQTRSGRRIVLATGVIGFLVHSPMIYLHASRWNGDPADIDSDPGRAWSWQRPPFLYPIHKGIDRLLK